MYLSSAYIFLKKSISHDARHTLLQIKPAFLQQFALRFYWKTRSEIILQEKWLGDSKQNDLLQTYFHVLYKHLIQAGRFEVY